ncbi:MAG TPA: ribosome maturation factor RimP, partial [Alicyclobacillus sp.]|nr:ribosome maturation factor RimP [Alicyclobacillus sp.]
LLTEVDDEGITVADGDVVWTIPYRAVASARTVFVP